MTAAESRAIPPRANLTASSPAFFGSIFGLIVGAIMICFGVYLLAKGGTPIPLGIAVLCVGAIEAASAFYTIKRVRVAWAFSMSINGTAFVVFLFTSARIRDAAGAHLAVALIPCLVFLAIVLLQALHSEEF